VGWTKSSSSRTTSAVNTARFIARVILKLDGNQKLELNEALRNAFDPEGFDRMLHQRVDKEREDYVGDKGFQEIVYQIIEAADRENWLAKLIAGAKEANPGNAQLQAFLQKYPEYDSTNPPNQREHISGALGTAQIVLNENLVIFKNSFQNVLDKIDVMSDYKVLHDELHTLTFAVFPNVVEASGLLPEGKDAKSNLSRYDKIIRNAIDKMREAAGRKKVDEEESEWIEELDRSRKQLKAVLDDFDKENLQSAIQSIRDILETQPTRINKELWRAMNAENDRLPELIDILEKVLVHMTKMTPPPSGIQQFQTGVESLKTLTAKLDALINEHDTWQEVVGQLFQIDEWIESDLLKFKTKWQKLRTKIAPFYIGKTDEETAEELEKADGRLEQALLSTEGPAPAIPTLDRRIFEDYREKASWRFYDVDGSLLKRCVYLREIRKQLPDN
jgi:hypothetical protein